MKQNVAGFMVNMAFSMNVQLETLSPVIVESITRQTVQTTLLLESNAVNQFNNLGNMNLKNKHNSNQVYAKLNNRPFLCHKNKFSSY